MTFFRGSVLLVALAASACFTPTGAATPDGGAVDTDAALDAGPRPDVGPSADAGSGADAGPSGDAGSPSVWGWISVIEWNDVCDQWYLKTQWFGGVRAYFATAPEFNRALPHTLGFATAAQTVGACTVYDSGLMSDSCLGVGQCLCLDKGVECSEPRDVQRWCPEDQVCVSDMTDPSQYSDGKCVPLPRHFDVGTITVTGAKTAISMTPDALGRYQVKPTSPDDLFNPGDTLRATTTGGELAPLSFTARGVAPLAVPDNVVRFRAGQPATVRWTPADSGSRVQVVLNAGSHDPNPLGGAIVCDVPDSDGQVQIAASLLDRLWYLGCEGAWMMKCSRITRYSQDLQTQGGKHVELFVGSARNLQLLRE